MAKWSILKNKLFPVDPDTGKKIRGQKCEVKDYDQFVFDIYAKYIPQPVGINMTNANFCNCQ